jgi:uridine kinase
MFDSVVQAVDFNIEYAARAAPLVARICELNNRNGAPLLVGICGRSRSGKTTMAHAVARSLEEAGVSCLHVRLDDWIVPVADRTPHSSAKIRNRVDELPTVVRALRAGQAVYAPGYDTATRGAIGAVKYDPTGRTVILLDGSFAGHHGMRALLDLAVFVTVNDEQQRERFEHFYRWKTLDESAIASLWLERADDEWPEVDAQQDTSDIVLTSGEPS